MLTINIIALFGYKSHSALFLPFLTTNIRGLSIILLVDNLLIKTHQCINRLQPEIVFIYPFSFFATNMSLITCLLLFWPPHVLALNLRGHGDKGDKQETLR